MQGQEEEAAYTRRTMQRAVDAVTKNSLLSLSGVLDQDGLSLSAAIIQMELVDPRGLAAPGTESLPRLDRDVQRHRWSGK